MTRSMRGAANRKPRRFRRPPKRRQAMIQDMPVKRPVAAFVAIALLLPAISHGAERFQKLSGSQIRAKFTGMEMTDNVHWADVFGANGELRTFSMGKKKEGKWRVEKDERCVPLPPQRKRDVEGLGGVGLV